MSDIGLGVITLEASGGGVAAVSRLIWRVFEHAWPEDRRLMTLLRPGDARGAGAPTSARVRFGLDLAASQALGQCRWLFYTHLAVARVQQYVPSVFRKPYGVFIHGIEVWRELTTAQRRVLEGAHLIVSNSAFTAARVTAVHPWVGKIHPCPLALLDEDRSVSTTFDNVRGDSAQRRPRVVLVGRIAAEERYKGHDQLLEAWPAVRRHVTDAELVFVGTGNDVARLQQKARDLGVGSSVSFAGFVDDRERSRIYRESAVFAMPSREEGFGLAYLEAMSHDLPCIGSRQDAAGEVVVDGETGFLVEQSDIATLANRVVTLLTDEPLRVTMGRRGHDRLNRCFTYDLFRDRFISLLAMTFGDSPAIARRRNRRVWTHLMRVLHVIPGIAPRYGGPSAAVVGMCRALSSAGVATLTVTTDADGPGHLGVPLEAETVYEGVPAMFFRRQLSESFKWSRRLGMWLDAHVAEFDVVHVHAVFSHSSIAAGRACRAHNIPYIVRPLGTLDPWSVGRKRVRKTVLFRLGVQHLLSGASAMHYTSDEEQRLAHTVVPNLPPGVTVPLGIDDEFFARVAGEPTAAPYVLSISRVHEKKQLDVLIAAFHALARQRLLGSWRLVIAGDGEPAYVATLKEIAASGEAADRIEFRGWVGGSDKLAVLRRAQLVISASHQENFGIAVVEAMACGVPALVSPGVNLANDIRQAGAGWIAEPDALAEMLGSVLSNSAELSARGRAAATFAGQFRWPVVAARLMSLYESLGAGRARARVGGSAA